MKITLERAEVVRQIEFRVADGSDGQTLEGYAAVFNAWTDIRDSMGVYKERIAPGAFKRSLGQRQPVLQFDHGTHPLLGSLPLGSISTLREDRNGLFVKARLSDNWLVQPVRDAIRDGGITGMSFRFRVIADQWGTDAEGNDTRTINEVELLELGPVVFPAYEQTSVAVRSLVGALDDETRAELSRQLDSERFTDLMDGDVSAALRQALIERYSPQDNQWIWVRDHNDESVIFDLEGFDDSGTFRLAYSIQDGVAVLDEGDATPVTVKTTYVDGRSDNTSTSTVAVEPAKEDDGPAEPPVASHDNRTQIAEALTRFPANQSKGPLMYINDIDARIGEIGAELEALAGLTDPTDEDTARSEVLLAEHEQLRQDKIKAGERMPAHRRGARPRQGREPRQRRFTVPAPEEGRSVRHRRPHDGCR
jgi:HK97 family phage prohead protease